MLLLLSVAMGAMAQTTIYRGQHFTFQGIPLNQSFRSFCNLLRAKNFHVDVRDESDYCIISGSVCGISGFDLSLLGDYSDNGKIYGIEATKTYTGEESLNMALETIVDRLRKAYPRYEDGFAVLVDEKRNMIDMLSMDVHDAKGSLLGSVYISAQHPDGIGEYKITVQYMDHVNSLAADGRNFKVTSYDVPIDISQYVSPAFDSCTMEIADVFLRFICTKGGQEYEMIAMGEDRGEILSTLYSGYTTADLQKKLLRAYLAQTMRVYNGNVMACTNNAFDAIHDKVIHETYPSAASKPRLQVAVVPQLDKESQKLYDNVLKAKNSNDMGWSILEYIFTHKSSGSKTTVSPKIYYNGLQFDNSAAVEDYKNAQGLK